MWRYSIGPTVVGDRLAVRDLRLADGRLDGELALHAVDQHLEVQLAHPGDHRLAGLLVGADAERRVLVGQRLEGLAELVLVALRLRLDGHVDDRLRELHALEDDGIGAIAERVARGRVLEPEPGDDVTCPGNLEVLPLVGVHQQDAAEALALLLDRVVDLVALVHRAGVDAEVRQLAEGIGDDLERQGGERRLVVGLAHDGLVATQVGALRRRDVERARQVVDDGVEHRLDALVLERRAGEHRHEVPGERADADDLLQVGLGQRLVAEVLLEHLVVLTGDRVEQLVAPLLGLGELARRRCPLRGSWRPCRRRPR